MLKAILSLIYKDFTLTRGHGLIQALLMGLLLLFVFSLSQEMGSTMPAQGAATIFWLATAFCQVLVFNTLYSIEEVNNARQGLLLMPQPLYVIWLSKAVTGVILIIIAQAVFLPAAIVFLGQNFSPFWWKALGAIVIVDLGMAASGSLLGALSQGQAAKESLLSIILFPLIIPLLLAGIRLLTAGFSTEISEDLSTWFGIALAFDALFLGAGLLLFDYMYTGED